MLSFSQQVLKKITDTPTSTKIELYAIRNGTNNSNVVGNSNIDVGSSSSSGSVAFRNETGSMLYTVSAFGSVTNPTFENINVCNGTFIPNLSYNTNHISYTNSSTSQTLNTSVIISTKDYDAFEDNDNLVDCLYYSVELPKTLDNGSIFPLNYWAIVQSRNCNDLAAGSDMPSVKVFGFKFNGTTWIEQATAWNGLNFSGYNLQNVCSSLSIEQENTTKNQISIYPNPTNGIVHISTPNETIEKINVYDITGRLLKSQNGINKNEMISIQELPSSIYLIEVKTDKGTKTLKILKQ